MMRRGVGGQPGDSLYKHVGGDLVVVRSRLPAMLPFNLITPGGRVYIAIVHVPRSGVIRNAEGDHIVSVPQGSHHFVIWVSGPSAIRRELQERSPWRAVRRYARNRRGWRAKLRKLLGML